MVNGPQPIRRIGKAIVVRVISEVLRVEKQ